VTNIEANVNRIANDMSFTVPIYVSAPTVNHRASLALSCETKVVGRSFWPPTIRNGGEDRRPTILWQLLVAWPYEATDAVAARVARAQPALLPLQKPIAISI
jgi:hypothetical protein